VTVARCHGEQRDRYRGGQRAFGQRGVDFEIG